MIKSRRALTRLKWAGLGRRENARIAFGQKGALGHPVGLGGSDESSDP